MRLRIQGPMGNPRPVTSDMTIAELLEIHPEVRPALRARGIDLCCGGALSLAQAAEAKGIPVGDLMNALVPPAAGPIGGADSVRATLAKHPGTARIFEKHGLLGCGGKAGPDERIDLFAAVHRLDATALLAELNEAATAPAVSAPPSQPAAPALYPPFLWAALLCTLTLGATFGAYNLLVIHWALGPMPPSHHWVHAGFQVWGFVWQFIAGVSYHVAPRFLGTPLRAPGVARATLALTIAGQLLIGWGRLGELLPGTVAALAAGAVLQLAAVVGWAGVLVATRRRSHFALELPHGFLAAGILGFLAAAFCLAAGAVQAVLEGDAEAAVAWNQAVYWTALFGGALPWIQGMFLRTGPVFFGLKPPRTALVKASLPLVFLGILLGVVGSLRIGRPGALGLMDLGLVAVAASVGAFLAGVRPFCAGGQDRSFVRIIRMAFASAAIFAVLAAGYGILDLAGGASGLIHDGARHAFTLGFVTLFIFGMAGRIVPVFGGAALKWPALRSWGAALIFAAVLMRETQVAAALLAAPALLTVSGLSGIVGAAGVLLASLSILGTLRAAGRETAAPAPAESGVSIAADANVAALLASHPEALPILVEAGFTPLANPLLRATLARMVTLRNACGMHGVDLEALLARLRRACPHGAGRV